ncbi:MAG: ACP S-malonyltransferase [Dehalococcoidia bacterium]
MALAQSIVFDKTAFIFPGQGSQSVGMGRDLYERSPAAQRIFDEADRTLGFPLSGLCFDGPEEELILTFNAQPAIFTVSLAGLTCLKEEAGKEPLQPSFVAGHSLGEYTALVAADALGFPDALRLVRERGRLMQEANSIQPGSMAAIIGLDEATTEEICQQSGTQISNVNSRDQIVISGPRENLPKALDMARARGARKVVPLNVSSAFHSSLMEPTVEGMSTALGSVSFSQPTIPIVVNSSAEPVTTADELKKELMRQLCHCVHWLKSVEFMIASGVSTFVEIGPARVLTGLVRRIDPSVETLNLTDLLTP